MLGWYSLYFWLRYGDWPEALWKEYRRLLLPPKWQVWRYPFDTIAGMLIAWVSLAVMLLALFEFINDLHE